MHLAHLATVVEIIGSALGIAGGWMVSGTRPSMRRRGFLIWAVSDVFLLALGIMLERWYFTAMMAYFAVTAIRGALNNREGP